MILKERIPINFYKLFSTKYMDFYMSCLIELRRESSQSYSSLGLTEQECRAIINENLARQKLVWQDDEPDEPEDLVILQESSSAPILSHLIRWGWMKSDYDDKLNCNVLSFPEYSQLYIELFEKLFSEDDSKERESMLAVYSYLFTYQSDQEKNNDILKNALKTSKNLGQLLSNMQDGMGSYFDELSRQKEFRGIQEVLVKELNNSDSQKYAILTTTDSFYRYKEAVKELIDQILSEKEHQKESLGREMRSHEESSREYRRAARALELDGQAVDIVCAIEREFETIERKYNRLIEQKTVFAGRAAARIRYILQEGVNEEDHTVALINLLCKSEKRREILSDLKERLPFTSQFKVVTENSLYSRRERDAGEFAPQAVSQAESLSGQKMEDFIPKPLYTKRQLRAFMEKHMEDGVFTAGEGAVQTVEDLEKLLFIWQEATGGGKQIDSTASNVRLDKSYKTKEGFTYTGLFIDMGVRTDGNTDIDLDSNRPSVTDVNAASDRVQPSPG